MILGGALGGLFVSGGVLSRARAAGKDCLPTGFRCKVNGDCCKTLAGSQCCCRSSKKTELLFGVCADRDACLAIGGVCK
jgi:hypothetical protein